MTERYKGHGIKIIGKPGKYEARIFPPDAKGATQGTRVSGQFRTMGIARDMAKKKIND